MLSGNSLRQTVHTRCAPVHQAAKLVAVLLRDAWVTAGLVESNSSLPPGLWLTSPADWLPRTGISSWTLRSVIEYGLSFPFYLVNSFVCPVKFLSGSTVNNWISRLICYNSHLTALCPWLPTWAGTRKVKPIWILLKQETVSGSGISWAICTPAPRSRQITTPAPHHSVFTVQMPFLPPNQQSQSTEGIGAILFRKLTNVWLSYN